MPARPRRTVVVALAVDDTWLQYVVQVYAPGTCVMLCVKYGIYRLLMAVACTVGNRNADLNGVVVGMCDMCLDVHRGIFDEVRMWNTARTPEQVAAARHSVFTKAETGLLASWSFQGELVRMSDVDGHVCLNRTSRRISIAVVCLCMCGW